MAKVNIGDVAAAAGVSITTVSHALNGKGRLTSETRGRVREAAERLGYRPSPLARGLAGGRSGILALTVSSADGSELTPGDYDYFMQLMTGATSAAFERGFSLTLVPSDAGAMVLDHLPLDGAILIDPVPGDAALDLLDQRGVPVVTTGRRPDTSAASYWVDNDHRAAMRAMIEHLTEQGVGRVALLTPPALPSYAVDALEAFRATCTELAVEAHVEQVTDSINESGAYAAASRLLESSAPPDAICGALDRLALGALLAAGTKGIRVPEDLLVAACTDSRAARSSCPPLTALSLDPEQIGEQAVDLLVTVIESNAPTQPHRIIPFSVIVRASTQKPRQR